MKALVLLALAIGCETLDVQDCKQTGIVFERQTKYEPSYDGGTCFMRCDYGWEIASRGCGGRR